MSQEAVEFVSYSEVMQANDPRPAGWEIAAAMPQQVSVILRVWTPASADDGLIFWFDERKETVRRVALVV